MASTPFVNPLRQAVLQSYFRLHRVLKNSFGEDIQNLNAARKYARSLYEQNRHETDPEKIKEMIYNAEASAAWVEKCLVQVVSTEKGTYRVNLKSTHNYTPEFNMEESFFDFGKKGKCK